MKMLVTLLLFANILCQAQSGTFVDNRDGKIYKTVQLGKQVWMAENLAFMDFSSEAVCYGNDASLCEKYGALYTWKAALAACPSRWHLPSKMEVDTLLNNTGGDKKAVYKALIAGGSSGFEAFLGGYVRVHGQPRGYFKDIGKIAYFWTSSAKRISANADCFQFTLIKTAGTNAGEKNWLMSVRCVKD